MSGRYLLDTNIIIALFANEVEVKNSLAQADEVFIPSIAVGELFYGARKSGRAKENLQRIDEFIANNTVIECNTETARYYGEVKHKLRFKGRPLPENDIWIAALTLQYNLTLVTRDAHFQEVENLQTIAW
ncbi:PilT protein domain protein [Tolypothrix tenuis PCC 7101]|uniref:Ribonuclease VapC n=1 Tax=Tolypothrix tenuis PCC 7101 TaxID=231146 RepID=A0A1Z4MZ47_9CYAN|nr:type II toxin-antitoxin system VapC family toxin [Aulosira sp. FACHB-113]BAY98749.1 PilT protein domain protein [Tolypothrix tenuis PCC 7101]BAZ77333.1 PilT protein domain protein [Aulosira laxa NIES-50]